MGQLPSTTNNESTRREIARVAAGLFGRKYGTLVYEHGHWWLTRPDGSQYDVVDVESSKTNARFDFEQVTPPQD